MAFVNAWVETDPDGNVIFVSLLDDSDRLIKGALRERMEGDPAVPNLTGLIEVGSWSLGPKPRKGTARLYIDTDANILAYDATKREDGRFAFATDTGKLYHVATAGVVAIGYDRTTLGASTDTAQPVKLFDQAVNLSTVSTVEVSLKSKVLKANSLGANGNQLRVSIRGRATGTGGASWFILLKLGGVFFISGPTSGDALFERDIIIGRSGSASQDYSLRAITGNNTPALVQGSGTVDLTVDETLDLRGNLASAGTLTIDNYLAEVLVV